MKKLTALLLILLLAAPLALAGETAPDDAAFEDEEDIVREDILSAMEVYAWFVMSPLDIDENVPSPDGETYLVLDETLSQVSLMQERLDEYFSADISEALWSWGTYQDVNGWLYGYAPQDSPIARPVDPDVADAEFWLSEETGTRRVYAAAVYRLSQEEPETLRFVRELIDGRWQFTEFPFFW